MAKVYLGLGSNLDAHIHLHRALTALKKRFGAVAISPVYESKPVGFDGTNFLNLVVAIDTDMTPEQLWAFLRDLEDRNGRDRSAPKFSSRTLDVDILTWDDRVGQYGGVKVPRDEILKNAFVLKPFSDLAPELVHPVTGRTLRNHWHTFSGKGQTLWRTYFYWDGGLVSQPAGLEA